MSVELAVELTLRLGVSSGRVTQVRLNSNRPLGATRILLGRELTQIPNLVGGLYSVCGRSQGVAAWLACKAASGQPIPDSARVVADSLVLLESAREHALRLLVNWPRLLGASPDLALFQGLKLLLDGLEGQLLPDRLLDWELPTLLPASYATLIDELQAMLALDLDPEPLLDARWFRALRWLPARLLSEGLAGLGTTSVATLPALPVAVWEPYLGGAMAANFVARPCWEGLPREVGPLARMNSHSLLISAIAHHGRGVLTRLLARLLELQVGAERLWDRYANMGQSPTDWFRPAPGVGLASVETARGLLVHRVVARHGAVVDYRILAPTEWNFHPRGVLQGLRGLMVDQPERLRQRAGMAVTALDPCVDYRLIIDPDQGGGRYPLL